MYLITVLQIHETKTNKTIEEMHNHTLKFQNMSLDITGRNLQYIENSSKFIK